MNNNTAYNQLIFAIESLPSKYRKIVYLREIEELYIYEISERLNLLPEVIKSRLLKGKTLIHEYIYE